MGVRTGWYEAILKEFVGLGKSQAAIKGWGAEDDGKTAIMNVLGLSNSVVTPPTPKPVARIERPASEPTVIAPDDEATDLQSTLDRVNASMRNKGKSAKATEPAATEVESSDSIDEALARVNAKLKATAKAKAAGKTADQSLTAKEAAIKKAHDRAKASLDKIQSDRRSRLTLSRPAWGCRCGRTWRLVDLANMVERSCSLH